MKKMALSLLFVSLIAMSAYASGGNTICAQERHEMGPGHEMRPVDDKEDMKDFAEGLNLTASQMQQIKEIRKEERKKIDADRKKSPEDFGAIKAEFDRETPDINKIYALVDKISENHRQMLIAKTDSMIKIRKVLNREQLAKLKVKMDLKMKKHMEKEKAEEAK